MRVITNRPAVVPVVTFSPPAIQHREVECAVHGSFHAAGAGGFTRAARGVEPDVNALHQVACHVHIVIIQEYKASAIASVFDFAVDLLDQEFSGFISRMRFAGKNDLDRLAGIRDNPQQAVVIPEE